MTKDEQVYSFTHRELRDLALLLRKAGEHLPRSLLKFTDFVEFTVCKDMTIEEAERFFAEQNE